MGAANPLLSGMRGGSHNASDAMAEMQGVYTEHIPIILGGIVVASAALLLFLDRAGFRFAVEATGGRR